LRNHPFSTSLQCPPGVENKDFYREAKIDYSNASILKQYVIALELFQNKIIGISATCLAPVNSYRQLSCRELFQYKIIGISATGSSLVGSCSNTKSLEYQQLVWLQAAHLSGAVPIQNHWNISNLSGSRQLTCLEPFQYKIIGISATCLAPVNSYRQRLSGAK
jgi:hypothetical protein